MKGPALAAALVAATVLAGCGQAPAVPMPAGPWQWPAMKVTTTASEPFEQVGLVLVAWGDAAFAIASQKEPDLARKTVVAGDTAYLSYGTRWTSQPLDVALESTNRLVLWDLRAAAGAGLATTTARDTQGRVVAHMEGNITAGHERAFVMMDLTFEGNRVVRAGLASPSGRESPFVFEATDLALGFDARIPEEARPRSETVSKDADVQEAHGTLVTLLHDYQARHAGALPERVDADTLRPELILRGTTWPTNSYDGEPVAVGTDAGDFAWTRCALDRALFVGYRWDGESIREPFGASCT